MFSPQDESLENNVSTLPPIIKTSFEPNSGSGLNDMPTWMVLPDLDITSIFGSGHESEVDELALDDHGENVYSLEHLPASIRTKKRKRSPHSRLPSVHGDTLFGKSPSPTPSKKIRPPDEYHATPLTAPSLLANTPPTSNVLTNSLGNIRGAIVASSVDRSPNPLPSSSSTFRGTHRTLDIRTARTRELNRPHVEAEVTNVKDVEKTNTSSFELDLDELEIWTEASVASIVFGRAEYSRNLAGLEATEASQRMSLKNVKEETEKKRVASASEEFIPVPPTVAIPYLSLSVRCDHIIEEILGSFSLDTDSSEIGQSDASELEPLLNRRVSSSLEVYISSSEDPSAAVIDLESSIRVKDGHAHSATPPVPAASQKNQLPITPTFPSISQAPIIDRLKDKSPPPSSKHSTISGVVHPPKPTLNRPSPTLPIPPFLIDASYRPPPLFGHSHTSTPLSQSLFPTLTASVGPSAGPASTNLELSTRRVKTGDDGADVGQPSIPISQITHTHESVVAQPQLLKQNNFLPSATLEEPVVNLAQSPSEPVAEEVSVYLDDVDLFEISETPILPNTASIPTVFDSDYYNPRYRDLWAIGEDGQPDPIFMKRMRSQMVIAEIRTDIQASYEGGGYEVEDEIKIEDIGEENDLPAGFGSAIQIQETPSKLPHQTQASPSSQMFFRTDNSASAKSTDSSTMKMKGIDSHPVEDGNVDPVDFPELAVQIDQWTVILRSFIKGKKKFQPQDMLDMKQALLDVYVNRDYIEPSSQLAQIVLAFSNLPASDFPDDDELELRALATKSVQAWGARLSGSG